ncbi:carbohydrate kinase family protein, partial [Methanobrevibacter sp. OttesenSCG-928-I08]|nr:carbohydrate kinase family protein [Methanobrevibacter sp. OttesenSCG-928-I08]
MKILNDEVDVEVIGFGALNMDRVYSVENIAGKDEETFINSKKDTPGGSAANTIIGLSKLGIKTSFIGKIAEDDDGEAIELNLAFNEVFTNNLIYSNEGNTGLVHDFVDKDGNRALYVDPGVNDNILIGEINPKNVNSTKIIHYSSFVGDSFKAQNELLDALNDDIILSFDPGMIYIDKGIDAISKILNRTNILLINENELKKLFNNEVFSIKELAKKILNFGIDTVVVKKGSKGVYALNKDDEIEVESFNVDVVDTTGAGDSFNAGFLYSYLKGFSLLKSCTIGNWTASKSIQSMGMEGFPSKNELK